VSLPYLLFLENIENQFLIKKIPFWCKTIPKIPNGFWTLINAIWVTDKCWGEGRTNG